MENAPPWIFVFSLYLLSLGICIYICSPWVFVFVLTLHGYLYLSLFLLSRGAIYAWCYRSWWSVPSGAIMLYCYMPMVQWYMPAGIARCLDNSRGNMFQLTCSASPRKENAHGNKRKGENIQFLIFTLSSEYGRSVYKCTGICQKKKSAKKYDLKSEEETYFLWLLKPLESSEDVVHIMWIRCYHGESDFMFWLDKVAPKKASANGETSVMVAASSICDDKPYRSHCS